MKLNLDYCKVDTLHGISPVLHSLDLRYCWRVSDNALSALSNLKHLHHLDLTGYSLPQVLKQKLMLCYVGCENITDAGMSNLPSSVVWLNLTECYRISGKYICDSLFE
mgnify:CR=1 FL=1